MGGDTPAGLTANRRYQLGNAFSLAIPIYPRHEAYIPQLARTGSPIFLTHSHARELAWEQREQAVRQALRPFKYALPLVLLALIASGIYWQRRRRTLAIVDKTAEETRHE